MKTTKQQQKNKSTLQIRVINSAWLMEFFHHGDFA